MPCTTRTWTTPPDCVGAVKKPVHTVVPASVTGSHGPSEWSPGTLSRAREKRLNPTPPATALKDRLVRVERNREKEKVLASVQRMKPAARKILSTASRGEKVAVATLKAVVCWRSMTDRGCHPNARVPASIAVATV